jgi:putative ABC transport system permease protein
VLYAAVSATRETRAREYALMRAMGAQASLLRAVQRAELLGVGALAGLLASAGAACGALLALAAGWWGLRDVLRRPVVETLRRAAAD